MRTSRLLKYQVFLLQRLTEAAQANLGHKTLQFLTLPCFDFWMRVITTGEWHSSFWEGHSEAGQTQKSKGFSLFVLRAMGQLLWGHKFPSLLVTPSTEMKKSSSTAHFRCGRNTQPHEQQKLDSLLGKVQRMCSKMPGKESNSPAPTDVQDTTGKDDVHGLQSLLPVAQWRIQHPSALRNSQKLFTSVKSLPWV